MKNNCYVSVCRLNIAVMIFTLAVLVCVGSSLLIIRNELLEVKKQMQDRGNVAAAAVLHAR